MKPKIKSAWDHESHPSKPEVNNEPGKTIPEQAVSVKELLERQRRGLPLTGKRIPFYEGEDLHLPELEKLDLSEIHELREKVNEIIKKEEARTKKEKEDKINKYDQLELEFNELKGRMEENLKRLENAEKRKEDIEK